MVVTLALGGIESEHWIEFSRTKLVSKSVDCKEAIETVEVIHAQTVY